MEEACPGAGQRVRTARDSTESRPVPPRSAGSVATAGPVRASHRMQAENAKERRMLIPLLLLAGPARPAAASWVGDPPVRVWFNEDGRYAYGDKARVYVQTAADGYVVVLRSDARGNLRLLSPLDPDGDQRVSAGKSTRPRVETAARRSWWRTPRGRGWCLRRGRARRSSSAGSSRTGTGILRPSPTAPAGFRPSLTIPKPGF